MTAIAIVIGIAWLITTGILVGVIVKHEKHIETLNHSLEAVEDAFWDLDKMHNRALQRLGAANDRITALEAAQNPVLRPDPSPDSWYGC